MEPGTRRSITAAILFFIFTVCSTCNAPLHRSAISDGACRQLLRLHHALGGNEGWAADDHRLFQFDPSPWVRVSQVTQAALKCCICDWLPSADGSSASCSKERVDLKAISGRCRSPGWCCASRAGHLEHQCRETLSQLLQTNSALNDAPHELDGAYDVRHSDTVQCVA